MTEQKCTKCGKPIKEKLVLKAKESAISALCYPCWVKTHMPNTEGRRENFRLRGRQ